MINHKYWLATLENVKTRILLMSEKIYIPELSLNLVTAQIHLGSLDIP